MESKEIGKYKYFGCIGIFWYIDDKDIIEHVKFDLDNEMQKPINADSPFISPAVSHPMVWVQTKVKLGSNKKYTYYPRGRANYNVKKNVFEIDMDACLHNNSKFMAELYNIFSLDKRKVIIVPPKDTNKNSPNYSNEGHYKYHLCDPSIK